MVFFSTFAEANPAMQGKCVVNKSSFFAYLSFSWFAKIVYLGYFGQLDKDSFLPLCYSLKAKNIFSHFNNTLGLGKPKRQRHLKRASSCSSHGSSTEKLITSSDEDDERDVDNITYEAPKKIHLVKSLFLLTWKHLALSIILLTFSTFLIIFPSFQLDTILEYIQKKQPNEPEWHGYFYAIIFFLSIFISNQLYNHSQYVVLLTAIRVKSALTSAIYQKVFKLSPRARQDYTVGEIMNHMSVDTEELFSFIDILSYIIGVPSMFVLCIILLWHFLGAACLAPIAFFIIGGPITYIITQKIQVLYKNQMEMKDKRLRVMADILNGIKVIKLYAWELPFLSRVMSVRGKELSFLRTNIYFSSIFVVVWEMSSQLFALASYGIWIWINPGLELTPSIIFVSLSLFYQLIYPMGMFPEFFNRFIRAKVSAKRINTLLNAEELNPNAVGRHLPEGYAIQIDEATLCWSKDMDQQPVLSDISLQVRRGQLVAVVGSIGAGKSALLSSLLGELHTLKGSIKALHPVAYVPQTAWIQNATLRNNIIFTSSFQKEFYERVLHACALVPDLEVLKGGDNAEIGEKGINLSGGQKHRISLARAVYQDLDLYLLDDPLSAVDAQVASHLFQHVIGPQGLLANKTRLLVTHSLSILPETDWIVILDKGRIVEQGTYKQLTSSITSRLSELCQAHLSNPSASDSKNKKSNKESQKGENTTTSKIINDATDGRLVEEEKMEKGEVKWKIYLSYVRRVGISLFILIVLTNFFSEGFHVGIGIWLSYWSEGNNTKGLSHVNTKFGVYFGLVFAYGTFMITYYYLLFIGCLKASQSIHHDLLHNILRAPLTFFDTTPIGRIINRFSNDIETVDNSLAFAIFSWLACIAKICGIVIVISLVSYQIIFFLVPVGLFYFLVLRIYIRTTRVLQRIESVSRSPIYENFNETISGVSSIRAFSQIPFFIERNNQRVDENMNAYYHSFVSARLLDFILNVCGGIIVLASSILSIVNKDINPGIAGLVLSYCTQVSEYLTWMVTHSSQMETEFVSFERIEEYSNIPSEAPWEEATDSDLPSSWPLEGAISFDKLSVSYRPELPLVLRNLSLDIQKGEKVGIVGRTGAGKSSLVLSLFRIIEALRGKITIDGTDISKVGLHKLRSNLTTIPQDPVIFSGTLRFNLDPTDKCPDSQIWDVLHLSHLQDFVSTLSEGLDYELGEGGSNISIGQRQLICLARALLRRSQVLVLDEATSSMDLDTDQLVQSTIRKHFSECTVLTIAHRLLTIMDYDKVVVLADGQVEEVGRPGQLLENPESHFFIMAHEAGLV